MHDRVGVVRVGPHVDNVGLGALRVVVREALDHDGRHVEGVRLERDEVADHLALVWEIQLALSDPAAGLKIIKINK